MKSSNPELLAEIDALEDIKRKDANELEVVKLIAKQQEQIKLLELSVKAAVEMIRDTSDLSDESIFLTLSARAAKAATDKE